MVAKRIMKKWKLKCQRIKQNWAVADTTGKLIIIRDILSLTDLKWEKWKDSNRFEKYITILRIFLELGIAFLLLQWIIEKCSQ